MLLRHRMSSDAESLHITSIPGARFPEALLAKQLVLRKFCLFGDSEDKVFFPNSNECINQRTKF